MENEEHSILLEFNGGRDILKVKNSDISISSGSINALHLDEILTTGTKLRLERNGDTIIVKPISSSTGSSSEKEIERALKEATRTANSLGLL